MHVLTKREVSNFRITRAECSDWWRPSMYLGWTCALCNRHGDWDPECLRSPEYAGLLFSCRETSILLSTVLGKYGGQVLNSLSMAGCELGLSFLYVSRKTCNMY